MKEFCVGGKDDNENMKNIILYNMNLLNTYINFLNFLNQNYIERDILFRNSNAIYCIKKKHENPMLCRR